MPKSLNVVIVEDDEDLLQLWVSLLALHDYKVTGMAYPEQLDDEFGGIPVDLLITDLNLPGESGFSLIQRIRRTHPTIGIIAISAMVDLPSRLATYASGADFFLPKPLDPKEFLHAVDAFKRRLQKQRQQRRAELPTFSFDYRHLRLKGPQGEVRLSSSEANVLVALARSLRRELAPWQIVELLGENPESYKTSALEVRMVRLRHKLSAAGAGRHGLRKFRQRGYQLGFELEVFD